MDLAAKPSATKESLVLPPSRPAMRRSVPRSPRLDRLCCIALPRSALKRAFRRA